MLGKQAERLDVEREPVRGALGPGRGGLLGGQRVVRGVDLDQRKLARVEPQPLVRRVRLPRVPAGGQQRAVDPRRRAHPNLAHKPRVSNSYAATSTPQRCAFCGRPPVPGTRAGLSCGPDPAEGRGFRPPPAPPTRRWRGAPSGCRKAVGRGEPPPAMPTVATWSPAVSAIAPK